MGKIRVEDLATNMGIDLQDLVFKLKSIGVVLDDKNPTIDAEVIEGVLKGKMLHQPREVILRDKESKKTATPARRRPPQRRMPTGLRPPRRRMIQRVEQRIKTIPATEKPKPQAPVEAAPAPEPQEVPVVDATSVEAAATTSAAAAPPVEKESHRVRNQG